MKILLMAAFLFLTSCDFDKKSNEKDPLETEIDSSTQSEETRNHTANLAEFQRCVEGDQCIIVPYSHCCGSTKMAILGSKLDDWNNSPELHTFTGSCANMGVCADDSQVTKAVCNTEIAGTPTCRFDWEGVDSP